MTVTVRTEGFRELDQALAQFKPATARAVLRRAGLEAIKPFVDTAKRLVAVDEGDVRDSITASTGLSRSAKRNNAEARMDRRDGVQIFAGPASKTKGIRYASFLEFGTVDTAAQPYMRPAWDKEANPMLDRIKMTLGAEIERTAARQAKRKKR